MTIFQRIFSVDGLKVTRLAISLRGSTPNLPRFSAAWENVVPTVKTSRMLHKVVKNLFILLSSLELNLA
jgi:hypothetical protein